MGIKAYISSTGGSRVSINNQQRQTVRTVGVQADTSSLIGTLAALTDVDATDPNNNEVLVYDEASGKYVIKELPVINGGTF
jgi:hypothetical protein